MAKPQAKKPAASSARRRSSAPPKTTAARVSLNVGTRFGPGYEVVHKDGLPEPAGAAQPIGEGGASVVFRCRYRDLPSRAVKILAPTEELLEKVGWDRFEETFTREIRTLPLLRDGSRQRAPVR
jgi:hypothetical protein